MTDSNATPALKQAAQNPWYLLATLYGEPGWGDEELQANNRVAWNRYYASTWTDEQRETLKGRVDAAELVPFDDAELIEIRRLFQDRAKDVQAAMPEAYRRVDFSECRFDQTVHFSEYVLGNADFRSATFSGGTNFSSATFSGYASFNSATFSGVALFPSATFSGFADFSRATFSGVVLFPRVTFSEYADFSRATFSGSANFSSATFHGAARFTNSELKAPTEFEGSRFKGEPPRFHGGKLHEDTVWRGVEWPTAPADRRKAGRFTDAYERLKQEMDRLKKHEDELMFFAKELECRRVAAGWFKGLPIAAYGCFCGYGRSYVKPLIWMVALFDIGVPALWLLQPDLGWGKAVGLSAVNCLAGLGMRKELMGKVLDNLGPGALIVSGAQTVAGLILLFLIGLGLRNRFRMK